MLATSVAFVKALSAFLSDFYGELTNDENKTSGKEAWSPVCSIVRRMLDGIAVHRCRASFVGLKSDMKQQVATEHLWTSLQAHRVMAEYTNARVPTPPFDRADYQLPPLPSFIKCRGRCSTICVQRSPGGNQ
jgi:hypothetical protein